MKTKPRTLALLPFIPLPISIALMLTPIQAKERALSPIDKSSPADASPASEQPLDGSQSLVWEARKGNHAFYLAGTIHLLRRRQKAPELIESLYERSRTIVFETDLWNLVHEESVFLSPDPWLGKLSGKTRSLLDGFCEESGIPCEDFGRLRPGFFCTSLDIIKWEDRGYDSERGIDSIYSARAADDDKNLGWLESHRTQIDLLNDVDDEILDSYISHCINANTRGHAAYEHSVELMGSMNEAYNDNKARRLAELIDGEFDRIERIAPELIPYFIRIYARHKSWIKELAATANEPGPVLVLVGAAHILARDSLIGLLRDEGYELRPIYDFDKDAQGGGD